MVRQHDTSGADTDRLGPAGDVANTHSSGGASDTAEIVMLGQPEPREASGLGVLRQVECVGQRVCRGKAFAYVGEVEYGEFYPGDILMD